MLLDEISAEGLNVTFSKRGGGTPAKQFAHIHNVRYWKLEKLKKELAQKQGKIDRSDELCHELLRIRLLKSAEAVADLLKEGYENEGLIEGYRRGVYTLMGYLIAHEAHHRSNMIQTLKQCDHKLSRSFTINIWDWNKI